MLQGFTRCTPNATYTLPFSVPVHRTISPGLFGPVHQIRLAAPFTSIVLRPRFQLCSPSSSPEPSSLLVSETVLHPRFQLCSPESSPLPSSVPSPSFVLHPRLRNRPSSSFSALFTGFVSGTVLRPVPLLRSPSSSPEPFSILVFIRPVFWGCN